MSAFRNGDAPRFPRAPRRTHVPNLSFTRPPAVEADQKIWPAWCNVPVGQLGLIFLDEDGRPLKKGGV